MIILHSVDVRGKGLPVCFLDTEQCKRYPLRAEQLEQTV